MANMKVKIVVGDQIKGTFNNPISPMLKRREEKPEQPLLKTSILRKVDIDIPYQNVNELYNECAKVRATLIRSSNNATQELTNISRQEEIGIIASQSVYHELNDISSVAIERDATEEEMMIFDSIEAIHEDDRTESENAFIVLYADGNCPPLDELEKALIPIREERSAVLQNEAAASLDEEYLDPKYAAHQPNEDDVETFEKIRPMNKKRVLDEY